MKNIFKQIVNEEIENALNSSTPKYFISIDENIHYIKIGKTKRKCLFDMLMAETVCFHNFSDLATTIRYSELSGAKINEIIPTDINYYDVLRKNIDRLIEKTDEIRKNSTEGYFSNCEVGDIFWVQDEYSSVPGTFSIYIVGTDEFKELRFVPYSNESYTIEKGVHYINDYPSKVNYIDRMDGLKIFKMYDMIQATLKNIYNKYAKK